jgi:hypothetical protein
VVCPEALDADVEVDADAVPLPPLVPLPDELMPTPNSGGLALVLLPEPLDPAASCLAAGMGIWYCFPAGEPGSTCTPVGTGT